MLDVLSGEVGYAITRDGEREREKKKEKKSMERMVTAGRVVQSR